MYGYYKITVKNFLYSEGKDFRDGFWFWFGNLHVVAMTAYNIAQIISQLVNY